MNKDNDKYINLDNVEFFEKTEKKEIVFYFSFYRCEKCKFASDKERDIWFNALISLLKTK